MLKQRKNRMVVTVLLSILMALLCTEARAKLSREFKCEKKYLNFPVYYDDAGYEVQLHVDGKKVRQMGMALADPDEADFWVYLELDEFKGKKAKLIVDESRDEVGEAFDAIYQADTFPGKDKLYKEKLRPQIHFTSKRGWNNDTNGMVYYDGEYHMFYQHNPYGWPWGNMTWGHAVSTDMIFWEELGDAIHPDDLGTIFSGGAVVDHKNTSGFQTGKEKPIVCFYTYAGDPFTQAIAYSNDRGRTWTKYKGNPIIGQIRGGNRDPKVIWHEPTKKWVMMLYMEEEEMDIFNSTDLKKWTKTSRLKSFGECPELFELPVDGDKKNMKWITYGGSSEYFVGSFDGKTYEPETKALRFNYGNAFYASQTFSDIPKEDGRRIMMGWGLVPMLGMPFNQMITFPIVLSLKTTDEGIRMFSEPVKEIEKLHKKKHAYSNIKIAGAKTLKEINGGLFHIKAEFNVGDADKFGLVIREFTITYNAEEKVLVCKAPKNNIDLNAFSKKFLDMVEKEMREFFDFHPVKIDVKPIDGKITLEVIVDRTMVEVFVNDGRYYMPIGAFLTDRDPAIKVFSKGGETKLENLEIYELKSIWE